MTTENRIIDVQTIHSNDINDKKIHPWRLCPTGSHYVKTHSEHIQKSKIHPDPEGVQHFRDYYQKLSNR